MIEDDAEDRLFELGRTTWCDGGARAPQQWVDKRETELGAHLEDYLTWQGIETDDREDVRVWHGGDAALIGELLRRHLIDRDGDTQLATQPVRQGAAEGLVSANEVGLELLAVWKSNGS